MKKLLMGVLLASLIFTSVPVMAENQNPTNAEEIVDARTGQTYNMDDVAILNTGLEYNTRIKYNLYLNQSDDYILRRKQGGEAFFPSNGILKWSIANTDIADIDMDGSKDTTVNFDTQPRYDKGKTLVVTVTAKKPGTTTLKAEYTSEDNKTYSYTIPIKVHRYKIELQKNFSGKHSDGSLGKAVLDKVQLRDVETGKLVTKPVEWSCVTDPEFNDRSDESGWGYDGRDPVNIDSDGNIYPLVSYDDVSIGSFGVEAKYDGEVITRTVMLFSKYYSLKVDNALGGTSNGIAGAGSTLNLFADESNSSKLFDHWEVVKGNLEISDKRKNPINTIMPTEDVEVKAVYKNITDLKIDSSDISKLIDEIERLQKELSSKSSNSDDKETIAKLQEDIEILKRQVEKQDSNSASIKALQDEINKLNAIINGSVEMYRLYNPNSGEHFYTSSADERNRLVESGWTYENVAWNAPKSGIPVYRLYNPNAGDHHYTTNAGEKKALIKAGWKDEGIGWYSSKTGKPVYREYNPNAKAGSHNYTTNKKENDYLISIGWKYEGIGWYAE